MDIIQAKDWLLLVVGVVLGIVPTIVVSHYYFKRSTEKSLSCYLMFHASPMSGMAPRVRKELGVEFRGQTIGNLIEAQFLIVNDGYKAVRDVIKPLSLQWPDMVRVLDAQVVQTNAQGINSTALLSPSAEAAERVELSFDLLNAREWLVLKVIADGPAEATDWKWSIVSDDLPRGVALRRLTLKNLRDLPRINISIPKAVGFICFVVALCSFWWLWANPIVNAWAESHEQGVMRLLCGFAYIALNVVVFAFMGLSIMIVGELHREIQPWQKRIPSLPKELVEDVWRGYSAQVDAAERLKKSTG